MNVFDMVSDDDPFELLFDNFFLHITRENLGNNLIDIFLLDVVMLEY